MIHLIRLNLMTQTSFLLTPSRLGLRDCFPVYTDNGLWMLAMFEISCTYFSIFSLSYCIKRPDNARYWRKGAYFELLGYPIQHLVLLGYMLGVG
jgi:hypothetical protein